MGDCSVMGDCSAKIRDKERQVLLGYVTDKENHSDSTKRRNAKREGGPLKSFKK